MWLSLPLWDPAAADAGWYSRWEESAAVAMMAMALWEWGIRRACASAGGEWVVAASVWERWAAERTSSSAYGAVCPPGAVAGVSKVNVEAIEEYVTT